MRTRKLIKLVVGGTLIAIPLTVAFTLTALTAGFWMATAIWGGSGVLSVMLISGIWLVVGEGE